MIDASTQPPDAQLVICRKPLPVEIDAAQSRHRSRATLFSSLIVPLYRFNYRSFHFQMSGCRYLLINAFQNNKTFVL